MHLLIMAMDITSVWTTFSEAVFLLCLLRWGLPLNQSMLRMLLHRDQRQRLP
jgi:hypothetical protein